MVPLFAFLFWDRIAVIKAFNRGLVLKVGGLSVGESLVEGFDAGVTIHRCVLVILTNIGPFGEIEESGTVRGRDRLRVLVKVL